MKFATLIRHAAELLRIIRKSSATADSLTAEYLRSRKYIGSSERKIISELVFNTLRTESIIAQFVRNVIKINNKDVIKQIYDTLFIASSAIFFSYADLDASEKFTARLAKFTDTSHGLSSAVIDALNDPEMPEIPVQKEVFVKQIEEESINYMNIVRSGKPLEKHLWGMNETVSKSLEKRYSPEFISKLSFSLIHSAPVCIRVNTLKISRDKLADLLTNKGITSTKSRFSPVGLILNDRPNLNTLEEAKNGLFWIQDIGSQMIGYALGATERSSVLDACAGAGGKTLHIATILENKADILASDIEFKRLKEIKKRAEIIGISCIRTAILNKVELKNQTSQKFDFVIIDAPCSGMGTVRRMPMPKWRLTPKLLKRITNAQTEILNYYSGFVADGGILLYATCSILPDENFDIVDKFLATHNEFAPESIKPSFEQEKIDFPNLSDTDFTLQLSPLNGETDGFFMAKMRKTL